LAIASKTETESKVKKLTKLESQIESNLSKFQRDINFFQGNDNCPTCRQAIALGFKEEELHSLSLKVGECTHGLSKLEEKLLEDLKQTLGIKTEPPKVVVEETPAPVVVKEEVLVENPVTPMPELPVETIVTQSVKALYQGEPKDIQKEVDKIPDLMRREIDALKKSITDLHSFARRQSQMGGGGEVNLRYLDDVARETISDGRWLKYDGTRKKFVFDEINPYEVVYNTTEITTSTYTVQDTDYYIGVNYAGAVTITLPASANSGRMIIIKDEDGDAETNPITVEGTVDNDTGGFIIQINNGAIQMIYRNGWRII
jgi:hypothetical protein